MNNFVLSPYPEYTKQTRCNNDLNLESKNDFFRPIISNIPIPLQYNHENYSCDNNALKIHHLDIERSSICTRNNIIDNKNPVQQSFQNNYYTTNFETFNKEDETNKYLTRNPVNSRRDDIDKIRNIERQDFMKIQGGVLSNYNDIRCENTRKDKIDINSSNYIAMPRTMAIPKENI
jgi:hypothetical protein